MRGGLPEYLPVIFIYLFSVFFSSREFNIYLLISCVCFFWYFYVSIILMEVNLQEPIKNKPSTSQEPNSNESYDQNSGYIENLTSEFT